MSFWCHSVYLSRTAVTLKRLALEEKIGVWEILVVQLWSRVDLVGFNVILGSSRHLLSRNICPNFTSVTYCCSQAECQGPWTSWYMLLYIALADVVRLIPSCYLWHSRTMGSSKLSRSVELFAYQCFILTHVWLWVSPCHILSNVLIIGTLC